MALDRDLVGELCERHPEAAAAELEVLAVEQAVSLLRELPPRLAARVLACAAPPLTQAVLGELEQERAAAALAELSAREIAVLVRRLPAERREALVGALPRESRRAVIRSLQHPEGTAGGLCDPEALALPEDATAEIALERVRGSGERAHYNVYVLNREQALVGVVNLRDLLLASAAARLSDVMERDVAVLPAGSGPRTVVEHPGWREFRSLPVVDERGGFVGALRYRVYDRLRRELYEAAGDGGDPTARALGDLLRAALSGLVDAMAVELPREPPRREEKEGSDGT